MRIFTRTTLLCSAFLLLAATSAVAQIPAGQRSPQLQRFEQQRREILTKFHAELDKIIRYCQQNSLADSAEIVRAWKKPVTGRSLLTQPLPETVLAELPSDLPEQQRAWRVQLRHQRKEVGQDLYLLSRRILNAGEPTAAWNVLREVAWYDPGPCPHPRHPWISAIRRPLGHSV